MDEILEAQGKSLNARLDINMPWYPLVSRIARSSSVAQLAKGDRPAARTLQRRSQQRKGRIGGESQ
jgi:hypothetical protein